MKPSGVTSKAAWWGVGVVSLILISGTTLLIVGTRKVASWTGSGDKDRAMQPSDLAEITMSSVQYIQTLTMAVFGAGILLLGQRVLGAAQQGNDDWRRVVVVAGFCFLVLAIAAGFISIELLLEAADQELVDEKVSDLRLLRILQSSFLALGFVLIGGALGWDILRGNGEVKQ